MIPVGGSFPSLLAWHSLLPLKLEGGRQGVAVSQELSVVAHLLVLPQDWLLLVKLTPEAC